MRQPWRNSLIIKMFDGNLGYMGLMRRLKKKWSIKGELSLTDIGCKYFIARFTNKADYNYVLTQGPWMLDDNYLTIRKWVPNFVPDEAPIKVLRHGCESRTYPWNTSISVSSTKLVRRLGRSCELINQRLRQNVDNLRD